MPLPVAVQRRVDEEATAWVKAHPDPLVPDPVLRAAAHRFADATAPVLLDAASAREGTSWTLGLTALVLAVLAVLGLVLPLAAVPLLAVAAVLWLCVAWGAAATVPAPPLLDDVRSALRAAAYRGVLARRSAAAAPPAGARQASPQDPVIVAGAVPPPSAERGRATYEAAVHLVDRDTSRVIDL